MNFGVIHMNSGGQLAQGVFPEFGISMSYHLIATDARQSQLNPSGWRREAFPDELGMCCSDFLCVAEGLTLVHTKSQPRHDLAIDSAMRNEKCTLVITLGIQGKSGFRGQNTPDLQFRNGHTTLVAVRDSVGKRHYDAGETVEQFRLLVSEDVLGAYFDAERCAVLLGSGKARLLTSGKTSCSALGHAAPLMACAGADSPDRLGMHIHALSLLAETVRHLSPCMPEAAIRFSQRDIERLEGARTFMREHLEQPLTVSYLSMIVGLNEFKLKEAFRYLFNTSPYRMLLELRMHKAWSLLETGQPVTEVAYAVGYQHPSSFSAAFTRFFGRTPKSVFGRRRKTLVTFMA